MQDLVSNRKATFHYEVLDTLEVGISLLGTEIKSLRQGGGSLQDAFVTAEGGELYLVNASIAPYSFGSVYNHDERRKRKLLAHRREIVRLASSLAEKGLSCVPLSMYLKAGRLKVKIALVRGKKQYDKRTAIKERDEARDVARAIRSHSR